MDRRQFTGAAAAAIGLSLGGAALAAKPPANWDDLVRVDSKRLSYVYLLPGASFKQYTKVMLDPTQIAFRKDWQKDYNSTTRALSSRITDADVERAIAQGGKAATDIFAKAFAAGGYPVVTAPGPDALLVRTAIVNLHVSAPDKMTSGRTRTYANEAGSATLVIEVMDSVSGAILGRAVDSRLAGDRSFVMNRNSATNRADFRFVAQDWAKDAVSGLNELKRLAA
jgi:hypothetical protein